MVELKVVVIKEGIAVLACIIIALIVKSLLLVLTLLVLPFPLTSVLLSSLTY
jgi:hypothetical protein